MAPEALVALIAIFVLAFVFDYINGFHDTANAIATSVSTRALKPEYAILLSATANFAGALILGQAVAGTIGSGIVHTADTNRTVLVGALLGAIAWNLVTWFFAIPSSSSHALIGGLIGSSWAAAGINSIQWTNLVDKVLVPLVTSPALGLFIGLLLMVILLNVFVHANPRHMNDRFRRLQILSAAYMALSHGSNDAQKTMGIMTLALYNAGVYKLAETGGKMVVPIWVMLLAAIAMSLGTAAGGWRIMKTMGQRVVKLDPVHGFAAETTAASIIVGASHLGMPVSTTHVISTAIMGVGSSDRFSAVRWGVAGNIVTAWVLTIPAAAIIAALGYTVLHLAGA